MVCPDHRRHDLERRIIMRTSQLRFIRQQGFTAEDPDERLYAALILQPRIVGGIALVGLLFQNGWLFLALCGSLWWSTLLPRRNAFDAIYNLVVAKPHRLSPLGAVPAPRRFAMGMAGIFALVIGLALLLGAYVTAWIFEGVFIAALGAVFFARFCVGAYLFHTLRLRSRLSTLGVNERALSAGYTRD
jgi:hypothetical protein